MPTVNKPAATLFSGAAREATSRATEWMSYVIVLAIYVLRLLLDANKDAFCCLLAAWSSCYESFLHLTSTCTN